MVTATTFFRDRYKDKRFTMIKLSLDGAIIIYSDALRLAGWHLGGNGAPRRGHKSIIYLHTTGCFYCGQVVIDVARTDAAGGDGYASLRGFPDLRNRYWGRRKLWVKFDKRSPTTKRGGGWNYATKLSSKGLSQIIFKVRKKDFATWHKYPTSGRKKHGSKQKPKGD